MDKGDGDCILTQISRQKLLDKFLAYLGTPDGGMFSKPDSYLPGVRVLLAAVPDLNGLTPANVEKALITDSKGKLTPKTVTNHLDSVRKFLNYILLKKKEHRFALSTKGLNNIRRTIKLLPNWTKAHRKDIQVQHHVFQDKDYRVRITETDVRQFKRSDFAMENKDLLSQLAKTGMTSMPTQQEYLGARNYTLAILSICNAHRAGVVMRLTLQQYREGMTNRKAGSPVTFSVPKHKTTATHGAATLCLQSEYVCVLEGFILMREKIQTASDQVFVNFTGGEMSQSNIACALSRAFGTAGLHKTLSNTKLRKLAVSIVHTDYPEKKSKLARHMLHSERTAVRSYFQARKIAEAEECTNLLTNVLLKYTPTKKSRPPSAACTSTQAAGLRESMEYSSGGEVTVV